MILINPIWLALLPFMKGKEMKNYMQVNGKKIEISQETAANLEREFGSGFFAVGDRLVDLDGWGLYIVRIKNQIGVIIESGDRELHRLYNDTLVSVGDMNKITTTELSQISMYAHQWTKI
jgi:hypothetical protein